ncbi:MAG: hypothetical protein Q7W29_00570, partial [bacterium]|nr:hypothetical protein [bacterium]
GAEVDTVEGRRLRFSMPAALCSYCLGETRIGAQYQLGNVRKIDLGTAGANLEVDADRQRGAPLSGGEGA